MIIVIIILIIIIIIIKELIIIWRRIVIKTIPSALTGSHLQTLAIVYTNNNMPTLHSRTWTKRNKQERGQIYGCEKRCVSTISGSTCTCSGWVFDAHPKFY